MNSINFTVHDFVWSHARVSPSEQDVLNQGFQLIQRSVSKKGWKKVEVARNEEEWKSRNAFLYAKPPPAVVCENPRSIQLKDWGAAASSDEAFNMECLEDFCSLDMPHASFHAKTLALPPSHKRARTASPAEEPTTKRRKLHLGPLYRFVPKPHMHPSPFLTSSPLLKGRPFQKYDPIFIAPYTTFSIPDYTRVAWLIPVRGTLPWDKASSGAFLDPSEDTPASSDSDTILWTETSLLKFWQFLLELRHVGALGPLGISFHAARQQQHPSIPQSQPYQRFKSSATDKTPASEETTLVPSTTDHIKLYHDASRAFYIRNALDLWSFQIGVDPDPPRKVRVFRGVHLVLMDDASKTILIS